MSETSEPSGGESTAPASATPEASPAGAIPMEVGEGEGAVCALPEGVPRSARELLVTWANSQDGWVRWIVNEVLSTRRELSPAAVAMARDRYLSEKGLRDGTAPQVPVLPSDGFEDSLEGALRLVALRNCCGVNALAAEQEIRFHPRMTVLFGENAMGKTGYVRVLKQLANVRAAEPIIPDIHRPSTSSATPEATITYAVGGVEQEIIWHGETGLAPFTRMTVFDSPAIALHLEGSVTYVFTPADLSLFKYSHAAIEAVRALLEGDATTRQPGQNPFLSAFTRGTPVYAEIESLNAGTDMARLTAIAQVPEAELAQLEVLRTSVGALSNTGSAGGGELLRSRSSTLQNLITLAEAIVKFDPTTFDQAIGAEVTAVAAQAVAADAVFAGGQLPPELRPTWQRFLEVGEQYLEASGKTDYPQTADECIYCGQALDAASCALVRAYREYASGAGAAAVAAAQASVLAFGVPFRSAQLGTVIETLKATLPGLEQSENAPDWVAEARQMLEDAAILREAVALGVATTPQFNIEIPRALLPRLQPANAETQAALVALEGDAAERTRQLADARARVAAMEARLTLARLLPEIRGYVDRATWVGRLRTLMNRFPALLRNLTETSKIASQDVLNKDFERVFFEECVALRAPNVTLDFPGRRGEAARRKTVDPDHNLAAILSQGEQKVIAIADFLAETSLRTASAPIVFDDPVDSFDHRRISEIAKRIADLSDNQQVIVFTHDIMFAANLLSHFEERRTECSYFQVTEDNGRKGVVSKATHARLDTLPSISARVNEAIQNAQAAALADREPLLDTAYGHIRAWCEVSVETKLLAKVTQRYQPNVAMQQLERIKGDRLGAAVDAMYPIWEKSNRYITAHSQPLETLGVRPTLDELRNDWATLRGALEAYEAP